MNGARQRKWQRIRWRWSHLLLFGLVFCRAFVSPVTRQALGAPEEMEAEVVSPPASLEAGTLEVIGENTSAPVRLLYSTGVQSLLALLSKLQNTPEETSGTCLQALLKNIPKVVENVSEQEIPPDLERDFEEALQSLPDITAESPGPGNFELENLDANSFNASVAMPQASGSFLQKLSRLSLMKRLPEIAERLAPFDVLYPDSLAQKSKIEQQELKEAFQKAAIEVREADISSWSTSDFEEAIELFERNPVLKEEFYGQTATFALGFLLAPILLFGVLVAACCGGFGGSDAPVAGQGLPLYTLGGKFG
eukprot:Skav203677  [mRNA]  locus=scaffold259:64321:68164:+ [translate_table: standard]